MSDVDYIYIYNIIFVPQGCVRTIDGTHIECVVPSEIASVYRNRKGFTSQNVMTMVDFEIKFTNLVVGWEGFTHDAHILNITTTNPEYRLPHAPPGMLGL